MRNYLTLFPNSCNFLLSLLFLSLLSICDILINKNRVLKYGIKPLKNYNIFYYSNFISKIIWDTKNANGYL